VYERIRTSASEEGVRGGAENEEQDSGFLRFRQPNKATSDWQVQPKKTTRTTANLIDLWKNCE